MNAAAPLGRLVAAHWPLPVACALFLAVAIATLDDHGRWPDEKNQRAIGNAPLDYLAGDGERAFDRLLFSHDRFYGAAFETPLALAERILGLEDEGDISRGRHLLSHLFFLVGGAFCYLLVFRLFGSRTLAILALILFLLHPRLYAHSFFNSKDIPFAAMFMVALYLAHRAFRRDTLAAFLLCGAGVGLLANLRITGLLLVVAVLVLRALDLALAGHARERGRVLLTTGAFALAAALTYYASLPALWTDPVGRFMEMARVLSAHPTGVWNLFRGEWLYGPNGPPPAFVPVWVGITTPPATLLLAATGAVALAWRGIRRPREVLRNTPLRFGFLLAALPVVATAAAVALDINAHYDWRHLYFLYGPLLLLAVLGLHWILRGRWMRAGAYALAGASVAVAVVSMARIHPYEANFFNALVDRTTPERLPARYNVVYWNGAVRSVLEDVLEDHPSGSLAIALRHPLSRVFPSRLDGARLAHTNDFRSGEPNFLGLRDPRACSPPLPAGVYASRLYAGTLFCVVDPVAYFGNARREARTREPLASAAYDVFLDGRGLVYLRDDCPPRDLETRRIFLHVDPVDAADLPGWRREYGFDNLDISLSVSWDALWRLDPRFLTASGARIDGNCVATALLPDYPIARVRTGQFTGEGQLWAVEFAWPDER